MGRGTKESRDILLGKQAIRKKPAKVRLPDFSPIEQERVDRFHIRHYSFVQDHKLAVKNYIADSTAENKLRNKRAKAKLDAFDEINKILYDIKRPYSYSDRIDKILARKRELEAEAKKIEGRGQGDKWLELQDKSKAYSIAIITLKSVR